jgi:hypothetical protein
MNPLSKGFDNKVKHSLVGNVLDRFNFEVIIFLILPDSGAFLNARKLGFNLGLPTK